MSMIDYALKGNLKRFSNNLNDVAKETNIKKSKLVRNFLYCFLKIGSGYSDYLNYKLYSKSKEELREYVTIKDQDKFYEIVSPSAYKTFFTVKPNFLRNFKDYISRDFFYDGTFEELETFLNKHEYFMVKPIDGLGGHGVERKYTKDIKNHEEFYQEVKNNKTLLEEYVIQHEKINELCSSNVNTLRIMTFRDKDYVELLFAALRVGNGKADVDNFHKGGMGILVDLKTGKLVGNAYNKNLDEFTHHPMSHIKFDGFQIPNWDIIVNTVMEAAKVNEHIHVVGWDVAITPEGCTFIEGNRRPGFDLVQVVCKRGRKDIMRHCLDKLNEIEHTNYKI